MEQSKIRAPSGGVVPELRDGVDTTGGVQTSVSRVQVSARPDWDEYFLSIARVVATRSTCPRASVGAVVVKDKHILATGYNGAPSGMPHCNDTVIDRDTGSPADIGCDLYYVSTSVDKPPVARCRRAIHAEMNAMGAAARFGIALDGATWYMYPFGPCPECERSVAATNPAEVVFPNTPYNYDVSAHTLKAMNVNVRSVYLWPEPSKSTRCDCVLCLPRY